MNKAAATTIEVTTKKEQKIKMTKEERIKKERESLINKLAASNTTDARTRVAFVLNHYPNTRNSDIFLAYKFWEIFQPEHFQDGVINQKNLFKLERMTTISRARAKIQNEYGLFQADEEIRHRRRGLETKEREEQIADKPGIPTLTFHLDESGKSQKYTIVGGFCSADAFRMFKMRNHLEKWKIEKNIIHEFHFTEASKGRLEVYKEYFKQAMAFSDTISFKAVAVLTSAVKGRSTDEIVAQLYYQLVHKGMKHEISTGRASLPRSLSIYKDKEEGTDLLLMTKVQQEIEAGCKKYFEDQLKLDTFEAVDSKSSHFIQLADLFIGSVSRMLNKKSNSEKNHKDELAEFILSTLGINLDKAESDYQDIAFVELLGENLIIGK